MPPNRFESEVESFLEGSHGDRTHIKRADHPRLHHYAGRYWIKLSQQEQNAPNWEILGLLGEFCTGTGAVWLVWGEFCTGTGTVWLVWGEFCTGSGGVPVLLLVVAGQNSPCSACWQQKRDKTLPARAKRTKLGDFGRAG